MRGVGVAEQRVGLDRRRRRERDAGADREDQLAAVPRRGARVIAVQMRSAIADRLGLGPDEALAQHDELVAADPGQRVARGGRASRVALAIASSSWSPTAWPRLSLITLKRSMSRWITATLDGLARQPRQRLVQPVDEQAAGSAAR